MAKGFKHGAGGPGLNFKVIGNPQPETARENTVWVDTDHKITFWIFSAVRPETPQEGMVWFLTGKSSSAKFNTLRKNGVMVYPQSCEQYIDGQWVALSARVYLSGSWKSFSLYLYDNGDECMDLTGGWNTKGNISSGIAKNQTNMYVNLTGEPAVAGYRIRYTSQMIDLTNISRLYINVGNLALGAYNNGFFAVGKSIPNDHGSCHGYAAAVISIGNNGLLNLDVSQLTGEYYIWFGGRLGGVSDYYVRYTVTEVFGE